MAGITHEPLRQPRPPVRRRPREIPPSRLTRIRRVILVAAAICLMPVVISYLDMLAQRSDSSVGVRTVEWLKSNGASGIINQVESMYYSLNAPATGGPALKRLPHQTAAAIQALAPHYAPPALAPLTTPALAGEGIWRPTFAPGGSRPPVLVTSFRSEPRQYPQLVAGVAWIDHTRARVQLYPGLQEPAVHLPRGPMQVPPSLRGKLLATFNSGFKLQDSGGGFAVGGHTYAPLKNGLATIVGYTDGRTDVVSWTGGPSAGPTVAYARQNLPLIVNHGRPNPNLSDGPQWGATLGNAIRVWRSAVGIDSKGNLLYAAANYQTVGSLAAILIHAGAVRAMELDINSYWTSFITYRHPGAANPANLLAAMTRSRYRYLTPDDRDFFAVYLR
ncbi:MAG: phosphodiester glycosidase family protein [Actinomycetota bacterium]|nr:phosphodiester glycosidase family protein [Actinomycetota bacterium]